MPKSEILRKDLESKSILKVGGAFDAMSAKLVEINGFDAVWAGGFAISATHALPDASILTMTEFLNVASNMEDACDIPIIADCDTGFGGPSNVSHMVKKYEKAGVAAVCIEDKTFPKQNSLLENGQNDLISEKDFVAKIIAAKDAKQDQNFMVIARIEALISGAGMDEALKRASAYEKAGADAILIHSGKDNANEILKFKKEWGNRSPVIIIPTTYHKTPTNVFKKAGFSTVIWANHSLRA